MITLPESTRQGRKQAEKYGSRRGEPGSRVGVTKPVPGRRKRRRR